MWKQVLKRNANSALAYNGIGKAYVQNGDYTSALAYLRYSGDKYSYSKSFGKNRLILVRKYGSYVIGAIAVLAVFVAVKKQIKKRKCKKN